MLTIEKLKEFGADTQDGLERSLDDADFYLELVAAAMDRKLYENVDQTVRSGRIEDAFAAAHALKGALGNLALTPIYEPVSEMTEFLRAHDTKADYDSCLRRMWDALNRLEEISK